MKIPRLPVNFSAEKEVEFYYSASICDLLKCPFVARFRTDGIYDTQDIRILGEYKTIGNLLDDVYLFNRCIIQILCYIKKIEDSAERIPNLIFIGTGTHFSIFETALLSKYLDFVDSSMVPNYMFSNPPKELMELLSVELNVPKYKITDLPIIENLLNNYKSKSGGLKMSINTNNIVRIFENFITSNILVSKLDENEQVALFASVIFNECDNIEGKPHQIVTPLKNKKVIKINRDSYDAFLLSIKSIKKPSKKSEIISQSDRLIEEVSRRFHGEFYTPKIWVDEAHRMIEKQFGTNWKDEYVVWDPACGTGNLTRDYQFKELYCSTLNQSDIDIMNQRGYNNEAVKFQYDFLNDDSYPEGLHGLEDDMLDKVAPTLVASLKMNKPIIIFMNPPYSAAPGGIIAKARKSSNDKVRQIMKDCKLGKSATQVYARFLFRIMMAANKYKNNNINICIYAPPVYLTGPSFLEFRSLFLDKFSFIYGDLFNASHFSDTTKWWGILFSIWKTSKSQNKHSFQVNVKESKSSIINTSYIETLYNIDETESAKDWARLQDIIKIEYPTLTSGLRIKESIKNYGSSNMLFYLACDSNTISHSEQFVLICNLPTTVPGFPVEERNFYKAISYFTSRRISARKFNSWSTITKQFIKPSEQTGFAQWKIDCIPYFLFHGFSQQTSVRNMNGITFKNQCFWLSVELLKQLADHSGFDDLYQDTIIFKEDSFVYHELQRNQLSQDAKEVLDKATELVIKSTPERKRLHQLHPDWHLNAWDAGWYQIKKVLKESMKSELDEFNELYKVFENRMKDGVYKFGFLK